MSARPSARPRRRERLRAIADQHIERPYDARAVAQLSGREPVARWAAVTSEGDAQSSHASNGNLLVADTVEELAARLASEVAEGWPTHGRAWDLDGEWDPWGNLSVAHRVELSAVGGGDSRTPDGL